MKPCTAFSSIYRKFGKYVTTTLASMVLQQRVLSRLLLLQQERTGCYPRHLMTLLRHERSIIAHSRKKNIFTDPGRVDDELKNLYSSSRFNDDDDDDDSIHGTPVHQEVDERTLLQSTSISSDNDGIGAGGGKMPRPKQARVKSAEFIKSSVRVEDCPPPTYPEFAVIGRSNVGKSSLINLLTGRNALAMVSKTPGKTKCINHFFINKSWYLVDLPGYGYARTSKENIMGWNKFTRDYFANRETLVSVLLLIDASIPPMDIDIQCASWFGESEIPFTIVYTKLDKKKKGCPPAEENIREFEERLLEQWESLPVTLRTSSKAGLGKNGVLQHIAQLRALYHHEA